MASLSGLLIQTVVVNLLFGRKKLLMFSLAPSALRSVDINHREVTSFGGRNSSYFCSHLRRNTRWGCHFFIQFIIHPTACSDESFILTGLDWTGSFTSITVESLGYVIDGLLLGFGPGPSSFVWDLVLLDVVVGDLHEGEEVVVDPSIICSLVGTLQGLWDSQ